LVDDLLREIPGVTPPAEGAEPAAGAPAVRDKVASTPSARYQIEGVSVSVSQSDGIIDVHLSGHIDSASSAGLEKKLRDLTSTGPAKIVVDLTDVSYVSSGGWGIFVGEVGGLRKRGGDVVLSGMSPEVFDVYELLGFADVLRSFATAGEARAWLSLPAEQRGVAAPVEESAAARTFAEGALEPIEAPMGETREWQSLRVEATTVGERGEIAVLSLAGIIDTVSAERLREALDQVITAGRNRMVVDMSNVEYVSSGGWGVFTERLREVRRAGGDIKLFGMDPDVYYVFTMLGFNIVLSSFDIFADAVDDFRRAAPGTEVPATAAPLPSTPTTDETPETPRSPWLLAAAPGLDIAWGSGPDGIRIARLSGLIETTAVSLVSSELDRELERLPRGFVFDLSKVEYISSSGWGQFARAFEATRAVALVGMGPDLTEVYDCLEFRTFIPSFATEAEALQALASGDTRRAAARPSEQAVPRAPVSTTPPGATDDGLEDVLTPSKTPRVDVPHVPEAPRVVDDETDDAPVWGRRDWKGVAPPQSDVDVDDALSDRNKDRDHKLRSLGWQRYGERLRERPEPTDNPKRKRKPDDDDGEE
jgi:anti-sigma B factor antagonist